MMKFKYITVTTPAKEKNVNFKYCGTNNLGKCLCKLEAQLSAVKSYVKSVISISANKINAFQMTSKKG